MAKDMKPITVTFKEKERDLYDYAAWHNSPAAWIKDLIRAHMEKKDTKETYANDISMFD